MADKIMEQALEILRHQRYYDSIQGLMGWICGKAFPKRASLTGAKSAAISPARPWPS